MLRTVGSLKLGRVPATGIMRTLQVGDRPTRLAQAFAEFGRIDKTIHTLTYLDDETKRRATLIQLNRGEGSPLLGASVRWQTWRAAAALSRRPGRSARRNRTRRQYDRAVEHHLHAGGVGTASCRRLPRARGGCRALIAARPRAHQPAGAVLVRRDRSG